MHFDQLLPLTPPRPTRIFYPPQLHVLSLLLLFLLLLLLLLFNIPSTLSYAVHIVLGVGPSTGVL